MILEDPFQVFCGGSIYDETTIITAAHCCDPAKEMDNPKVIAGDLDTGIDSGYEQTRGISNIMIHPAWLGADVSFENDVCLIDFGSGSEKMDCLRRKFLMQRLREFQ